MGEARRRAPKLDQTPASAPQQPGRTVVEQPLSELLDFIDWTPFFIAWELSGVYPKILGDPKLGPEATKLFNDAQAMLARVTRDGSLQARGVIGLWPARRKGDDIVLESGETLHTLRQQRDQTTPNAALADFVSESDDHVGGFAVTIHGAEELAREFERQHDDYNSILVKSLADRLAEAFAEKLHQDVRTRYWGYAPAEALSNTELIKEKYQGIRPAPGYPAQPDHTEKRTLFELLDAGDIGLTLTESCAMWPPSSVSGLYLAHPRAHYLAVGRIGADQVADYANRKGWTLQEAERWLAPILAYTPAAPQTETRPSERLSSELAS